MGKPLPFLDQAPAERADAARNREAVLQAALELIQHCGAGALTMDAVAARAGVGKGTVFRRFESREGLMTALLDYSEREWQTAVMSGPPPLGPGAAPLDRLLAFGRSHLESTLLRRDLIRAAGDRHRSSGAHAFAETHVRMLLGQLGTEGDLQLLASSLLAALELPVVEQHVLVEGMPVERVHAAWADLVRRVVR